MNTKGYKKNAEDIYRRSLKYSRGLWAEEDLRIFNLIDSLRTREKRGDFTTILEYINKIGDALQGSWYYKLAFIESVTYASYEFAIDYIADFANIGEINLNEGLKKFILTSLGRYPYKKIIFELLPLLDMLRFDEEINIREQGNIQAIYHALIDYSLRNGDIKLTKKLIDKYFLYLKRYIYVGIRLRLLEELFNFINDKKELKVSAKILSSYIEQLEKDGYCKTESNNSSPKLISDSQMNKVKSFAKKKSLKKILRLINSVKKNGQSYKIDVLISQVIPALNSRSINSLRDWCKKNSVEFITCSTLTALLEFSIKNANERSLKQTKKDILFFCRTSGQIYVLDELLRKVCRLDFDGKNKFIKQMIRCSIERNAANSYYLNHFILHASEILDEYFPEIKKLAFEPFKKTVENSMRLSFSKS